MKNFKAKIIENKQVAPQIYNLKFEAPKLAAEAKPGQFVEALCKGSGAPFLRRPFGVHMADTKSGVCEILFRIAGRGTELLSQMSAGDFLDITGPLGNDFEINKGKKHFIAGGGMGIAPLLFLAKAIWQTGEQAKIFLAAKTAADIARLDIFKNFGEVILSTEDGSLGEKCLIDTPLERALKTEQNAALYACGPRPMLRCVAELGAKYQTPTQVSLEEKMACGMGVCQGCPVEVKNKDTKYKMVCKDGPVFNAEDIVW
ncbi:MAG: dihydroorotate dehydrogenase electron transfer subunit [Elusimicrobiota bacterium]|jgi:dihydroorotate dehydrogenase electron transfer subunit|nr:dihydroorotate dehydrogenase electron transfer subunit [Elusimicrobiota bacterium]